MSTEPRKGLCTELGETVPHMVNGAGADVSLAPERDGVYGMAA